MTVGKRTAKTTPMTATPDPTIRAIFLTLNLFCVFLGVDDEGVSFESLTGSDIMVFLLWLSKNHLE
jgi:hypothetical protein